MIIPLDSISSEVLDSIIESYVLQEGTEYGLEDVSLVEKIEQVRNELVSGSAVVVYSELHETVNILPAEQFK